MQKILPILVVGILILSGFGAVALSSDIEKFDSKTIDFENTGYGERSNIYTHTILGEYGTSTTCYFCQFAHPALKNIYAGEWHPFYYISFVCDKNTHAYQRMINEMGLTGYPTVFFDGGYKTVVGAGSIPAAQAAYNSSIVDCGARDVNDVDINLDVTWNGNADMDIAVSVDNNEDSTYNGHLHVYVTEIVSSMGWQNNNEQTPYTFAFLDYAYNGGISVSANGTWQNSTNWDGHNYNDGYGNNFGGITYGNIMVIAAVFASNGYVDDTTGFRVGSNSPPNTPSNPDPGNGATNVSVNVDLNWTCTDPDHDVLNFNIYFGESSSPPLVELGHLGTSYDPGLLDFDTTYYWKIVAVDPYNASKTGPTWHFTTRGNDPPNTPSNSSPADGATNVYINVIISWTGGDPDGDDVTYDVYFGNSSSPPKVKSNQSSTSYDPPGVLNFDTTYYWKIVAWDEFNYSTSGPLWSFTTEKNLAPNTPSNPNPDDGATAVDINKKLSWTGGDPNPGDKVTYDVYFGNSSPPPLVIENLIAATYTPGTMDYNTTYYWQIVAQDSQGLLATGPIWHFTTELRPNQPPNKPVKPSGSTSGKLGVEYTYTTSTTDPDGDQVYYNWSWGDGTYSGWLGLYNSGLTASAKHIWTTKGTYQIKVKAKDVYDAESAWSDPLEVSMPRNGASLLLILLERFPHMFPILRHLMGL